MRCWESHLGSISGQSPSSLRLLAELAFGLELDAESAIQNFARYQRWEKLADVELAVWALTFRLSVPDLRLWTVEARRLEAVELLAERQVAVLWGDSLEVVEEQADSVCWILPWCPTSVPHFDR